MRPDHYERKEQLVLSLPPTVVRWLKVYGDGNLSVAVLELVRHVTDVDALYPPYIKNHYGPYRSPLRDPHERRRTAADKICNWSDEAPLRPTAIPSSGPDSPPSMPRAPQETEAQKFDRIKQNTLMAARAQQAARSELQQEEEQRQLKQIERDAFARSEAAYQAGKPLPDHKELDQPGLRILRLRILERCKASFGWETGPRPPEVHELGDPFAGNESAPAKPGRPMTEQERTEIAALESEARGELDRPASTADASSTPEPGTMPPDRIAEPSF